MAVPPGEVEFTVSSPGLDPRIDLETVFEAIDMPSLVLDAEGEVVIRNSRLEGLLGIDRSEVEGVDRIGEVVYDGVRERIFESGYSTTEDGTGFGLAIVAEIADAHGWDLRVTASEAGGARFGFEVIGVDPAD
ncbi:MAG: ATP-binding protein [Haloarculaceae archaeon]